MKPNTLDDLLKLLPGLRKLRSINAGWLRTLLDRPKRTCTWCGKRVGRGRTTWCSDECVTAFKNRCDYNCAMRYVMARDKGICKICGRNTLTAEREFKKIVHDMEGQGALPDSEPSKSMAISEIQAQFGFSRGRWHEVDHEIPIAEGGGLCDPKHLRVLCGVCHLEETKRLAARSRGLGA